MDLTAAAVLAAARHQGLRVRLSATGRIQITGPAADRREVLPTIAAHNRDIAALLLAESVGVVFPGARVVAAAAVSPCAECGAADRLCTMLTDYGIRLCRRCWTGGRR
jgi:hypothetical protein